MLGEVVEPDRCPGFREINSLRGKLCQLEAIVARGVCEIRETQMRDGDESDKVRINLGCKGALVQGMPHRSGGALT